MIQSRDRVYAREYRLFGPGRQQFLEHYMLVVRRFIIVYQELRSVY